MLLVEDSCCAPAPMPHPATRAGRACAWTDEPALQLQDMRCSMFAASPLWGYCDAAPDLDFHVNRMCPCDDPVSAAGLLASAHTR